MKCTCDCGNKDEQGECLDGVDEKHCDFAQHVHSGKEEQALRAENDLLRKHLELAIAYFWLVAQSEGHDADQHKEIQVIENWLSKLKAGDERTQALAAAGVRFDPDDEYVGARQDVHIERCDDKAISVHVGSALFTFASKAAISWHVLDEPEQQGEGE